LEMEEGTSSSSCTRYLTLTLLTLSYILGEMGNFLISTSSRAVAASLKYGDTECSPLLTTNSSSQCHVLQTRAECETRVDTCVWRYTGQGWQYQVLAGPGYIVMFTVSGIVMGYLADRVSRPRLLSASVLLVSVSMILSAMVTSYSQLMLLRLGLAAGEAAMRPAGGSLIAEIFSERQRGVANGIFSWGVYIGYALSFLFGLYLTDLNLLGQGWRATFVLAGLPGLLLSPALLLISDPRTCQNYSSSERKVSLIINNNNKMISTSPSYFRLILRTFSTPVIMILFLAASTRHTAGFTWLRNNVAYFNHYHPSIDIGYWSIISAIIGGCVGVFSGGFISDLLVSSYGVHSRLWILGAATIIASPFAFSTLYLDPPLAFITLLGYYFFAETWFSLLFTVLVEIVPDSIRSVSIGSFMFLMNNVGGNLPLIIDPLAKMPAMGLKTALYVSWPGLTGASGVLFLLSGLQLWRTSRKKNCEGDIS